MGEHACVGTGHCCSRGLCPLALARLPMHPRSSPCPKLIWQDTRYVCGFVLDAATSGEAQAVLKTIRSGAGCVAPHSAARLQKARALGLLPEENSHG